MQTVSELPSKSTVIVVVAGSRTFRETVAVEGRCATALVRVPVVDGPTRRRGRRRGGRRDGDFLAFVGDRPHVAGSSVKLQLQRVARRRRVDGEADVHRIQRRQCAETTAVTDDGAAWLALHRLVQIRECEAFARLQHSITNQLICFEHDFVVVFDDSRGLEHGVLSQVPFLGGDACWDKHERAHDAHQRETTDCPHRRPSVGGARTDRDVMETLLQNTKQVEKCKVLFRLSSRKSNKARVL